jgi:hypothetical protein
MTLLLALKSFCIGILTAYLGFTNTLAVYVESFLPQTSEIVQRKTTPATSTASDELVLLSRIYGSTAGSADILRNDPAFQNALEDSALSASLSGFARAVSEADIEASLVNILCEYQTEKYTHTTTGTGFFISDTGVILTNAHVGQFLLFEGLDDQVQNATCVIRTGDPATPRYTAELLFISPTWILRNAELITEKMPQGTGEYDYALLYVADRIDGEPIPKTFPSLPFSTEFLPKSLAGSAITVAGYPAEKLLTQGADAELVPTLARTTLDELYTFGSNYADIFAISPSRVGEQGASGGPVVEDKDGAIGLIVTKGDMEIDGATSLRALTLSYIDRTITEETGFSLAQNLSGDVAFRGEIFKKALAPLLAKLLSFELDE